MHIAPSGSPQPTKQAFICKLYSGFPCIFSQQKPHRRICIPQGAKNEVLRETQPRTSNHFSVMFFRKTRLLSRRRICIPQGARNTVLREKLSPNLSSFFGDVFSQDKENERRRTSVLQAKFDAVFGKLSPNLKSFFGDVFSQDKASKPPLYMHTARRKKRSFTGNSARTSAHFSAMFFRKTRKMSADVQAYFKRNLTPYCGKTARKIRFP